MKLRGAERAMYWVYVAGFSIGVVGFVVIIVYSLFYPGMAHR
jgi:hypothetical protein